MRVANLDAKEILLMADAQKFFNEPHYEGFPAVLVRLKEIGKAELRVLLADAWPRRRQRRYLPRQQNSRCRSVRGAP